jgi:hypothetical protein
MARSIQAATGFQSSNQPSTRGVVSRGQFVFVRRGAFKRQGIPVFFDVAAKCCANLSAEILSSAAMTCRGLLSRLKSTAKDLSRAIFVCSGPIKIRSSTPPRIFSRSAKSPPGLSSLKKGSGEALTLLLLFEAGPHFRRLGLSPAFERLSLAWGKDRPANPTGGPEKKTGWLSSFCEMSRSSR